MLERYDLATLKAVPVSGSALPGALSNRWMDLFGENLYNLYGSTEVAWATIATPEDLRDAPGTAGLVPRGTVVRLYDDEGNPLTSTLADYPFVSATELPSFELITMETPTPVNPLGAKGIGESGTIGSAPAVQSAVIDALAHLGVRHIDMPTTPMRASVSLLPNFCSGVHCGVERKPASSWGATLAR